MIQIRISERIREYSYYNMSKEPTNPPWERIHQLIWCIACEQAVWGTLVVGQEKEGELAITSLEFEHLHRKSLCKMLIGWDDIGNDVITLGTCCSILNAYICALFASHWLVLRLTVSSVDGEPQRNNWRWNSNSRDVVASPPSFFHPTTRVPWKACLQAIWCTMIGLISDHVPDLDHPKGMHPGYLLNKTRFLKFCLVNNLFFLFFFSR